MGTIDDFVRDLRAAANKAEVVKALRTELRKPIAPVRAAVRARALSSLPSSGGLNVWAGRTRVSAQVKTSGRQAGVKLKGSRKSKKNKSDLRRLDAGTVRHPSWGRRGPGQWHTQAVTPGYFTEPATEATQWREAAVAALDKALEDIRG